jgi:hypothetical protein
MAIRDATILALWQALFRGPILLLQAALYAGCRQWVVNGRSTGLWKWTSFPRWRVGLV